MCDEKKQSVELGTKLYSIGAIVWYDFKLDSNILYIYSKQPNEAVYELLKKKGTVEVCSIEKLNECHSEISYDYIVGIDIVEESLRPVELLQICRASLKKDGRLILGTENRYAIKYFCGDRDPYTNHNFDGIENYRGLSDADQDRISGRCYAMKEIRTMLEKAGFVNSKFYSVMPSLQETQLIYAEEYEPIEELAIRYSPLYYYPDSVFLEEQYLYTDLIKNGMFHKLANAYIVECSIDGRFDSLLHATISLDRGYENALVTSIYEKNGNKTVSKKAIYPEGLCKLSDIQNNLLELKRRGITVVDSQIHDNSLVMPFVEAPIAANALRKIAKRDKKRFVRALDDMYELILQSSDHVGVLSEKDQNSANGRDLGPILEKGYIDLVPLNCFYDATALDCKSRFIYYDQEFYVENCPAKAIMYRSIIIIFDSSDKEFERIVSRKEILSRYGLLECEDIWKRMENRFLENLRNQKLLQGYYDNKKINYRILYTNREKLNYSTKEYQRIFVDIFEGLDDTSRIKAKKLFLFGSGRFTEQFFYQFSNDYEIYSIIDNNSAKWGTTMEGIPINSPDILRDIPAEERHIIICIKGYNGVVNQLKNMGITDYHIYDPGNDYPNKRRARVADKLAANSDIIDIGTTQSDDEKPYNIGYIAGVFDLFHIGHLNMFKRAKEQCKYLIVGVVSDEGVRLNKQAEPFVPFEERIEMVRSCKYVDEAVKLPLNYCGTRDMFKIYHFDVQFSGSDYEHDPAWLAEKAFLEKNGSTMVFFPYTQSTSSTKLKRAINTKEL